MPPLRLLALTICRTTAHREAVRMRSSLSMNSGMTSRHRTDSLSSTTSQPSAPTGPCRPRTSSRRPDSQALLPVLALHGAVAVDEGSDQDARDVGAEVEAVVAQVGGLPAKARTSAGGHRRRTFRRRPGWSRKASVLGAVIVTGPRPRCQLVVYPDIELGSNVFEVSPVHLPTRAGNWPTSPWGSGALPNEPELLPFSRPASSRSHRLDLYWPLRIAITSHMTGPAARTISGRQHGIGVGAWCGEWAAMCGATRRTSSA